MTETPHGFVSANGGIDASNVPGDDHALLLPADPDASAAAIVAAVTARTGVRIGVIVTDTFGRPWRLGQTEVALGVAGTAALRDERGGTDLDGDVLEVTEAAVADEVAGAADLVRTKASGTPFVLVRGLDPRLRRHRAGTSCARPRWTCSAPAGRPRPRRPSPAGARSVASTSTVRCRPRPSVPRSRPPRRRPRRTTPDRGGSSA